LPLTRLASPSIPTTLMRQRRLRGFAASRLPSRLPPELQTSGSRNSPLVHFLALSPSFAPDSPVLVNLAHLLDSHGRRKRFATVRGEGADKLRVLSLSAGAPSSCVLTEALSS
jgi:hypothetical protein